ncbi:MAG: DUF262 domain-containing protein [Burkholderiales bacterium]|nr:DUF262 domain-containing protein [Burkholderiales bacterium]
MLKLTKTKDNEAYNKIIKQTEELSIPYDYKAKDIPIDSLIKHFEAQYYFIPDYQRKFTWDKTRKCQFIESLLLGVPINPFFVAKNPSQERIGTDINVADEITEDEELFRDTKVYEIIDGVQRFSTLVEFKQSKFKLEGLEKLTLLNDYSYSELPVQIKRDFISRDLRVIIISQEADEKIRGDIFKRINTSSLKLETSEIRKGAYGGKYYDMILELSQNQLFKELCPLGDTKSNRAKHDELVLKFFAYKEYYLEYDGNATPFLNKFVKTKNEDWEKSPNWVKQKDRDTDDFYKMLNVIKNSIVYGFRKSNTANSTPTARFEALAVGVGLALKEDPTITEANFSSWINSIEFLDVTTAGASNNKSKLIRRVEYVRDKILESV